MSDIIKNLNVTIATANIYKELKSLNDDLANNSRFTIINKITAEHRVTHFVDISRKCYSLTSFIIANTVKKTDEKAFNKLSSSLIIAKSLTSIWE